MPEDALNPSGSESRAPFMSHLKELRDRILHSAIAIVIGLGVGMAFGNQIIYLLKLPAGNIKLITTDLIEPVGVYFQVSLIAGVILAMPVLVYELIAFVAPGLTPKERRLIFTILPAITFMFLCGVAFAYFVALPPAINFLYNFNSDIAEALPKLSNYISVVTRILLILGLVFETPLIIMLLAKIGVVSPQWLAARRKWWVLLSFVLAAVATPTPDPVNMCIVAIPLVLLLELGILLSRLVYKKKREQPEG
jgi:sec-independent protein translocase protein TatC